MPSENQNNPYYAARAGYQNQMKNIQETNQPVNSNQNNFNNNNNNNYQNFNNYNQMSNIRGPPQYSNYNNQNQNFQGKKLQKIEKKLKNFTNGPKISNCEIEYLILRSLTHLISVNNFC